jgi:DNA primase
MTNKKHTPSVGDLKAEITSRMDMRSFYQKYLVSSETIQQDTSDGWSNRVLCPIHHDTNTPNFFANLVNGSFKCQACGEGGSVFDFWLLMNNLSKEDKRNFKSALVALATEANIKIEEFQRNWKPPSGLPAGATEATKAEADKAGFIPKHSKAEANDKVKQPIADAVIETMQKALNRDHIVYLNQKRGLSKKTIEEARIGFDTDAIYKNSLGEWCRGRYALPVFDKELKVRNIRLYTPATDPAYKMMNYIVHKGDVNLEQRYGSPVRLYGLHKLSTGKYQHVIICEGEWDCLLLNQMLEQAGYQTWIAVTGTHGANTFEAEWVAEFKDLNVYFLYDCDDAGKMASIDHVNKHFLKNLNFFASVRIVELPLDGSKEMKDVGDWFLKAERNCEDLIALCTKTPEVIPGGIANDDASQEAEKVADFVAAIKDRRYIDKRIEVPIAISGQTSKVYHAIRSYSVTRCPLMEDDNSEQCCSSLNTERTIPYGHPLFIEACMERERNMLQSISRMACQKEEKCSVSAISKVVMEEYFANQVVERWRAQENDEGRMQNAQELVQTSVYILQPPENMVVEPQNYIATGFVRTHPKTSIATFFIEKLVPMDEDWRKFTMETPENRAILTTLQQDFDVQQILDDITNGVTHIYKMDEILMGVLLTYLSPLWIYFNNSMQRGWNNCAIIGDSGSGKSATYTRFSDWVELGDLFSSLSGTRTGLLYAIKKKGDEWHVAVGRYVQASCKIIAIDEAQETASEEIKRMAQAMDTGYLKVDQVASGGYHTQTRTIFLMNPKDTWGKAATISDFTFGCDALRMCFDPMFIRRLDMAIFTTGNQKHEFYNRYNDKQRTQGNKIRLTSRMMRCLIYWAWTRRADQVKWSEESTLTCLKIATELSLEYGGDDQIPLANAQDLREKLARLSTAYAILDRSFSDDMECVHVKPEHVQIVAAFLDRIYSMPACNLKQKSKAAKTKNSLDDFDVIKEAFETAIRQSRCSTNDMRRQGDYLVRFLSSIHTLGSFRKRDLSEQLNVNTNWISKRIMILQGYNLVEAAKHGGYKTTRKFNMFMQRWLQDPDIEKIFSEMQDRIGRQALEQADSLDPYQNAYQANQHEDDPFAS